LRRAEFDRVKTKFSNKNPNVTQHQVNKHLDMFTTTFEETDRAMINFLINDADYTQHLIQLCTDLLDYHRNAETILKDTIRKLNDK
jgi:hypothetical protein